jgi:Fcf2 pre-rRNA processing
VTAPAVASTTADHPPAARRKSKNNNLDSPIEAGPHNELSGEEGEGCDDVQVGPDKLLLEENKSEGFEDHAAVDNEAAELDTESEKEKVDDREEIAVNVSTRERIDGHATEDIGPVRRRSNNTAPERMQNESAVATRPAKASKPLPGKKRGGKNTLTKLIPGYTAPMSLVPATLLSISSSKQTSVVDSLDALRLKAMHKESMGMQQHQQQKHQHSACLASAFKSFKTGRVPNAVRVAAKGVSAGDGWFHMKPTPMTADVERDLTIIRNRNYLDPKRFYKSADTRKNKHMVQVGTVVEGSSEYYSARLTKKQQRGNLTDEILADPSLSGYARGKYKKMQQEKEAIATKRKTYKRRGGRR